MAERDIPKRDSADFILPGFTTLWGVAFFSETVENWLNGTTVGGPTIGGFLYVTLAAVVAGLTVSTLRWAVIDFIHHVTGIPRPDWDYAKLQQHFAAYDRLESNHYRYYQFYGGMVIALAFSWCSWRFTTAPWQWPTFVDVTVATLIGVFFAGSRDTLRKFYDRTTQLLAPRIKRPSKSRPGK